MYKQVIIIRNDLKMSVGKIVSQGSHASLGSFLNTNSKIGEAWLKEGAKKIVLKVESLRELKKVEKKIKDKKLSYFLVKDAGLTQLKPRTITALCIGPAEEEKIDRITGELKLL